MKTKLKRHVLLLLPWLSLANYTHAQGTAIGYQGRLLDGGTPATGLYDFNFKVFGGAAGGAALAETGVRNAVPTTNGVFGVALDFGAGVFTGAARWLEISVRTNGVGELLILDARTPLLPTPYAIFAGKAGSVANSTVTANELSTVGPAPAPGQFLSYDGVNLAWTAPGVAAGNIWSTNGSSAYYNAGNVGIGTTSPSAYGHGGTPRILEVKNSGTVLNSQAHLMLSSGVSSLANSWIGSVTWAQPGGMGAYIAAYAKSAVANSPAAMLVLGTRNSGDVAASPKMVITEAGDVGIGTVTPQARLEIAGDWDGDNGALNLSGDKPSIRLNGGALASNHSWLMHVGTGGLFGSFLRTGPGAYQYVMGLHPNGNVGIGTSNPQSKLEVNGSVAVTETLNARLGIVIGNNPGTIDAPIYSDSGASTRVVLYNTANSRLMDLHCRNGDVSTLTIRGGADLAEPFAMSQPDVEPGSVVVIDDTSPGKLRLSTHAYDNKVAGIVSGANGVKPGISMTQEDHLDPGKNVALSGRVYVQADASLGAIKPGDLLTTSDTPGHAMKVSNHTQSQGAILGKAMSGLKEGKGMVLVLVTLQ